MKKIYSLLITALIISISANAQNPIFTWAKQLGGTNSDRGYAMATDNSGNVYTTGVFAGTTDFDPGAGTFTLTAVGGWDIFVSKLDANGNFVWAKQMGGSVNDEGYSIGLDGSGNIYTTGRFQGTCDFDPGAGVFNLTAAGTTDLFFSKLDASGNFVWAKRIGIGSSTTQGNDLSIDAAGAIYSTGAFGGICDFDPNAGVFNMTSGGTADIFVMKLSAAGNLVWAKQLGGAGSNDYGSSIVLDASGNVYSTGFFDNTGDFDPGAGTFNLTAATSMDTYLSKLDNSGNFVWAKQFTGNANVQGWSITTDAANNVFSCGNFLGTIDFDPGAGVSNLTSFGQNDVYVSKLNSAGNFIWAKQIGGATGNDARSISVDGCGNVYTTGIFETNTDFDPSPSTYTLNAAANGNVFISKLDASGNFSWAGNITSGSIGPDYGRGIVYSNSNIHVAGYFSGTGDFDAGAGTFTLGSFGSADIFTAKYASNILPSQPGTISGLTSMCTGIGASSYSISAVAGATSYSWNLPGGWSGSSSTNTISATPGTTGVFTVTANNACGASTQQTLNVTVNPLPTITVNSGSICAGQSFTMVPSGANTYTIQGGSAVVSPTSNASYTVIGTSTAGCVSSSPATSNVTVNPLPTIGASTSNTMLCVGQSATITASGASTYTFNPGGAGTNIVVSPTLTSTYTISGTSAQGCNNSSVFTQSVSTCAGINQISNSVSEISVYPNPFNNKITIASSSKQPVLIFNALGSLIYSAEIENGELEINLEKESSGIYFVKVGVGVKKIIKE